MAENDNDISWTIKLDWLNILNLLKLERINQISKFKKERAIKRVTKIYGTKALLDFEPERLDILVANELKELMKKELAFNAREREKAEEEIRKKFIPFKKGGIIRIDPRDLKDFDGDPEKMLKFFYKKFLGDDDEDNDDERDKQREDNTGYYI
ncbi:MAG: hypothetical protein ACFE8L_01490 [Candidatus Hodarchaeota archaeon]